MKHGSARDVVIICLVLFFGIVIATGMLSGDSEYVRYSALVGIPLGLIAIAYTFGAFVEARRIWRQMRRR